MLFSSFLHNPKNTHKLLFVFLGGAAICIFFIPLVLSIDSIYGFLAYKGTLESHYFNVITTVSSININDTEKTFVSWWSPGQWMLPALLNYFAGVKLGVACIIITILCNYCGLIGYYRLFNYFKFTRFITSASLLIIICSSTFYYSYFIYQGGEVLSFGIFPWFCFYLFKIKKFSISVFAAIIILFLCCFVAKSTLILYCFLAIFAKIIQLHISRDAAHEDNSKWYKSIFLSLSAFVTIAVIYFFYLSKGNTPASDKSSNFQFRLLDILIPLASPLNSILSIQEWLSRSDKIMSTNYGDNLFGLYYKHVTCTILSVTTIVFFSAVYRNKVISGQYKTSLICMYAGALAFFFLSYAFNAKIGYDARHYKLLGYLFVPGLLTIFNKHFSSYLTVLVIVFMLLAIADFVYLKRKWTSGRYISTNYFYRHYDNLANVDSLNEIGYHKLIALDSKIENKNPKAARIFIDADADIALDLQHKTVLPLPGKNFLSDVYHGKGPEIIICVSKKTLAVHENVLKQKFPDYFNFELIDETDNYLFFSARN